MDHSSKDNLCFGIHEEVNVLEAYIDAAGCVLACTNSDDLTIVMVGHDDGKVVWSEVADKVDSYYPWEAEACNHTSFLNFL